MGFSSSYNPKLADPSGSLETEKITGSCLQITGLTCKIHAMECELPQATRLIKTSSNP